MSTGRYEIEYRIIRPNGTIRWIPDREIPVFNENAELYRLVGIAEDITQRKTQSQQLAVLHRILRHNLRNDLTVVSGYAELIETIAGDEAKEYAKTIRATNDRLIDLAEKQRQIVTELESSSRPSVVELSALLQRVKRTVVETFPTADITIRIESETKIGFRLR